MSETDVEQALQEIPGVRSGAETVSRGIHDAVLQGGEPARAVADVLHGKWLGHPLHPALTDFVVGAWSFGSLLNLMPDRDGNGDNSKAAQTLMGMGIVAAVPTALAGVTDFSTISKRAMSTGATHGILNTVALGCYLLSRWTGRNGSRSSSKVYSTLGFGVLMASAWLGGKMTYEYRIGVNKSAKAEGPTDWTDVIGEAELADGQPRRIEVEGTAVLLYRKGNEVYAIGAVCSHEGGPLEEGDFSDCCVQCPWHQSVFDLSTGDVVHGPATYTLPHFDTRISNGRIQLRLGREGEANRNQAPEYSSAMPAEDRARH